MLVEVLELKQEVVVEEEDFESKEKSKKLKLMEIIYCDFIEKKRLNIEVK